MSADESSNLGGLQNNKRMCRQHPCDDAANTSAQPRTSREGNINGLSFWFWSEMRRQNRETVSGALESLRNHSPPPASESSGGQGQFLKAPQRLALQMKSLSRLPSICQKAAVCVTSVRWFTQNLKQNSSRSWITQQCKRSSVTNQHSLTDLSGGD